MDMSQLKSLGEIAGIGGIALGVVVLLGRPLISKIAGLPKSASAGSFNLVAIGCFIIGALGIAAWAIGNRSPAPEASTKGFQSPAVIGGSDVNIRYGSSPTTDRPTDPPATPKNTPAPSGTARTEGAQSPGIISGGKAGIEYQGGAPPAGSPPTK